MGGGREVPHITAACDYCMAEGRLGGQHGWRGQRGGVMMASHHK